MVRNAGAARADRRVYARPHDSPGLPAALGSVITRCLQYDRDQRPGTEEIQRVLQAKGNWPAVSAGADATTFSSNPPPLPPPMVVTDSQPQSTLQAVAALNHDRNNQESTPQLPMRIMAGIVFFLALLSDLLTFPDPKPWNFIMALGVMQNCGICCLAAMATWQFLLPISLRTAMRKWTLIGASALVALGMLLGLWFLLRVRDLDWEGHFHGGHLFRVLYACSAGFGSVIVSYMVAFRWLIRWRWRVPVALLLLVVFVLHVSGDGLFDFERPEYYVFDFVHSGVFYCLLLAFLAMSTFRVPREETTQDFPGGMPSRRTLWVVGLVSIAAISLAGLVWLASEMLEPSSSKPLPTKMEYKPETTEAAPADKKLEDVHEETKAEEAPADWPEKVEEAPPEPGP